MIYLSLCLLGRVKNPMMAVGDTPVCTCGGNSRADLYHIIFYCSRHEPQRLKLFSSLLLKGIRPTSLTRPISLRQSYVSLYVHIRVYIIRITSTKIMMCGEIVPIHWCRDAANSFLSLAFASIQVAPKLDQHFTNNFVPSFSRFFSPRILNNSCVPYLFNLSIPSNPLQMPHQPSYLRSMKSAIEYTSKSSLICVFLILFLLVTPLTLLRYFTSTACGLLLCLCVYP